MGKLLKLVPITVKAGQTFRGTLCLTPTEFDCSFNYADYCVKEGVAEWNAQRFLALMIEDIKADVRAERKLMRCKSFSELHDVCDANCLGDLCDDDHPIWKVHPNHPEGCGRFVNDVDVTALAQDAVDAWIKAGHPND